jgi:hypothetical protein
MSPLAVGSVDYGQVCESHSGQSIVTQFLVLGLPLVPQHSTLQVGEDADTSELKVVRLGRLHRGSVLAGYLRPLAGVGTFSCFALAVVMVEREPQRALLVASAGVVFAALWLLAALVVGKLPPQKAALWAALERATGLHVDPSYLQPTHRSGLLARLETRWQAVSEDDWRGATPDALSPEQLDLLCALAHYGSEAELAQRVGPAVLGEPARGDWGNPTLRAAAIVAAAVIAIAMLLGTL